MKKKSKAQKAPKVADLEPKDEAPRGGSTHSGGVNVALGDGSVRFVRSSLEQSTDLKKTQ